MPLVLGGPSEVEEPVSERHARARKVDPRYTEGDLVRVAGAMNQAEAEFVQGMLLEEGIPSTLRRTRGFDVPDMLAAGPRDVMVPASGHGAARDVLLEAEIVSDEPVQETAPSRVLAVLLGVLAVGALVIWLGTGVSDGRPARWCGTGGTSDAICKVAGKVTAAAPGAPAKNVAKGMATKLAAATTVVATARSVTKLMMGRQARCTLLSHPDVTEVVTRPDDAGSLYLQRHGLSACTVTSTGSRLPFYCDGVARCRAFVFPARSAQIMVRVAPSGAVTVDVCAGKATGRVQTALGHVDGFAQPGLSASARVRITFREQAEHDLALSVQDKATRGVCTSPVFAQQRRASA